MTHIYFRDTFIIIWLINIEYRVSSEDIKIYSFGQVGKRKSSFENSNEFLLNSSGEILSFELGGFKIFQIPFSLSVENMSK